MTSLQFPVLLGQDVEIIVKTRARGRGMGRITIKAAEWRGLAGGLAQPSAEPGASI